MVKKTVLYSIAAVITLGLMVTGCGTEQTSSPVTPSPDKPTFLYFFTDG
ncbi:MAG: hypothetical protein V3T55_05800 [Anaerolineales bacterium]